MKRLSTGELRILVKIKGTDRRALVDYNSRMLFNKFPEVCCFFLFHLSIYDFLGM